MLSIIDNTEYAPPRDGTLKCYLSTITTIRDAAVVLEAEAAREYRRKLSEICVDLEAAPRPEDIHKSADVVNKVIREQQESLGITVAQRETDIRNIIGTLADAAKTMGMRNTAMGGQLWGFSRELESVTKLDDLSQVRSRLHMQVQQLRTCADKMKAEGLSTVAALKAELKVYEKRLEAVETNARVDGLTGCYNREETERRTRGLLEEGKPFTLLLMHVNGFPDIANTYGQRAGEQVLKTFGSRIRGQMGAGETAGYWKGEEFVAVLRSTGADLPARIRTLLSACEGSFAVAAPKGSAMLDITASFGFAESGLAQNTDELFASADEVLSVSKAKHSKAARKPVVEVATPDPVTGLPARSEAEKALAALATSGECAYACVMAICDVASVNARYGRRVSDEILPKLARHLERAPHIQAIFRWSGAALVVVARTREPLETVRAVFRHHALINLDELVDNRRQANVVIAPATEVFSLAAVGVPAVAQRIDSFLNVRKA